MKKIFQQSLLLSLLLVTTIITGCSTSTDQYVIDQSDFLDATSILENTTESELSVEEENGLIQMREEEKLARDVYTTLGEQWGLNIFSNIARSEATHTTAVKALLDRYNIADPVTEDTIGVFTSGEMQKLYTELTQKGEASLLDALVVGATVEDLDIYDLNLLLEQTDNADIIKTYQNLSRGSRNHLRAYVRQIQKNGAEYSPQYISKKEFEEIISTAQEKGRR